MRLEALLGIAAMLFLAGQAVPETPPATCLEDARALLALGFQDFDQGVRVDENGQRKEWGWRTVYHKPGCVAAAADLIATWRTRNASKLNMWTQNWMRFHEGQLRAEAGQTARAIALIKFGYDSDPSWNLFVDAILAFLNDDRTKLMETRSALLALPEPANWKSTQALLKEKGQEMNWPLNIEAVDHLVLCFGRGYPLGAADGVCPDRATDPDKR